MYYNSYTYNRNKSTLNYLYLRGRYYIDAPYYSCVLLFSRTHTYGAT